MGEVMLTVPARFLGYFRRAAISEVEFCGRWVEGMAQENLRAYEASDAPPDYKAEDIRGSFKCLCEDMGILDQLLGVAAGPVKVTADASALAHVARAMADRVLSPAIAKQTNYEPFEDEEMAKVDELAAALRWAAKQAAHHNGVAGAELAERKAAGVSA
jgi:hypothetical protein